MVNLDALTYAGNPANLADLALQPRYRFVRGDVTDREAGRPGQQGDHGDERREQQATSSGPRRRCGGVRQGGRLGLGRGAGLVVHDAYLRRGG